MHPSRPRRSTRPLDPRVNALSPSRGGSLSACGLHGRDAAISAAGFSAASKSPTRYDAGSRTARARDLRPRSGDAARAIAFLTGDSPASGDSACRRRQGLFRDRRRHGAHDRHGIHVAAGPRWSSPAVVGFSLACSVLASLLIFPLVFGNRTWTPRRTAALLIVIHRLIGHAVVGIVGTLFVVLLACRATSSSRARPAALGCLRSTISAVGTTSSRGRAWVLGARYRAVLRLWSDLPRLAYRRSARPRSRPDRLFASK